MQTREQIEDIIKNGFVNDIFRMESALFLLREIGGRSTDINAPQRGNYGELFFTIQRALITEATLAIARIYDKPSNRYPTRCIKGVFKHLITYANELPEIREPYQLVFSLKKRSVSNELLSSVNHSPEKFPRLFSEYCDSELKQNNYSLAIEKLKTLRDKRIAHNENNFVDAPTWDALTELLDFAKYVVGVLSWAYFSTAYTINGEYILTQDAKRPSYAMSRLLKKIYDEAYPPYSNVTGKN